MVQIHILILYYIVVTVRPNKIFYKMYFIEEPILNIDNSSYGSGTLTRAFLQRVFQQCLTYDGEMDYKTYLDLVLALENRRQPAALAYLFRVLDINSQGYLDAFTLNYFFKVRGIDTNNFVSFLAFPIFFCSSHWCFWFPHISLSSFKIILASLA